MSFGKWYEEQKVSEGGGASSNSWFGDLTSGEQFLPLYEGMQPISFQSLRETMEAQMPKKIMGMNYQQRFQVRHPYIFI